MRKLLTMLRWRRRTDRARLEAALVDVQLQHLPTYVEMRPSLEAELRRARRYERPLSIIVATLDDSADQMRFMLLGAILQATLRECDILACAPDLHRYIIALPECNAAATQRAMQRIADVVKERTDFPLRAAAAAYPVDGLTLNDLVASANSALGSKPTVRSLLLMREQAG
jgi:hypothetical protein